MIVHRKREQRVFVILKCVLFEMIAPVKTKTLLYSILLHNRTVGSFPDEPDAITGSDGCVSTARTMSLCPARLSSSSLDCKPHT